MIEHFTGIEVKDIVLKLNPYECFKYITRLFYMSLLYFLFCDPPTKWQHYPLHSVYLSLPGL